MIMVIKEESQQKDSDNSDNTSASSNSGDVAVLPYKTPIENLPSYGNVSVVSSVDIHFGNRTFYQGPVTIKQVVYANGQASGLNRLDSTQVKVLASENIKNGVINSAFSDDLSTCTNNKHELEGSQTAHPSIHRKDGARFKEFFRNHLCVIISILAILLLSFVLLAVILSTKHHSATDYGGQSDSGRDPDEELDNDGLIGGANVTLNPPRRLKIVPRLEWLAQPPREESASLKHPVPLVIIDQTGTESCSYQAECVLRIRYIQVYHVESRNWSDITYNFLIGGDGSAYEGRGWKYKGAHTYGYNDQSLGIAFVGTFFRKAPSELQLRACGQLINEGVEQGYIAKDYKLVDARQLQISNDSPDDALFKIIKTWPHFVETIK